MSEMIQALPPGLFRLFVRWAWSRPVTEKQSSVELMSTALTFCPVVSAHF
jgi:hypothetical protein